eukprot:TRINITY_DN403_c0_g1_i3.p1 TRINITY_DN403_c0_g1~~TRINITY_DN403_c0_g1_i3.p1  ORF type:complete len:133 (+),score=37.95 TRINITY_DN403_c0_g1_i3:1011-1409(+)
MTIEKVDIEPKPELFEDALKQQLAKNKPLFVYVYAARNPETGISWCPDCVKAEPFLEELNRIPDAVLLECPVLRPEYKGNPSYPYRTHSQIQLKGVPTLIHWTKEGPQERLVEEELHSKGPISSIIDKVIKA